MAGEDNAHFHKALLKYRASGALQSIVVGIDRRPLIIFEDVTESISEFEIMVCTRHAAAFLSDLAPVSVERTV